MGAEEVYDFVIVGGGTSGLVVATRLTEDPSHTVLVLEAGKDQLENDKINTPAMWTAVLGSPEVDWAFMTEPQKHLQDRVLRQPQGKALGGSSALNAELFIAPSRSDFDSWATLGNEGWSWDTLEPYLKKCHTIHLPEQQNREHLGLDWKEDQSRKGPIHVSFSVGTEDPLSKAWIETSRAIGLTMNGDPFSGDSFGMYSNACSIEPSFKRRSYANPEYYVPASKRSNLTVKTACLVQRITLEHQGSEITATGVDFFDSEGSKHVKARKEVILAAGAFQSPKMLELSGIGKRSLLESLDIPVFIDNPNVGENLQDHLLSGICFEAADDMPTMDGLMRQEPEVVQQAMSAYGAHQSGPLTYGCFASHAFLPVTEALQPGGREELADLFSAYKPSREEEPAFNVVKSLITSPYETSACAIGFPAQVNLHDDKGDRGGKNYVQLPIPGKFITLGLIHSHPLSRGSVHVTSNDVRVDPRIDLNYLGHPLDIEVFARHMLSLERLAKQKPFADLIKPGGLRNHPSAHLQTLEEAKEYVRRTALSNNHPTCSCPMLPRERGGVVNNELLVYGTKNLRIVDSSIMPVVPRANTQSAVYTVAERAADIIKQHHKVVV